ncbi:LPD7 domain-containing protein [Sulfuricurvum sp.]|uniref:LPD7 domain-containing protein n=1 Tax=Sulfuricurvum sp. TaxID=2025608 RepID=UPI00261DFBF8|nr:LPD7 domain-containing protein [Sulfuricurvum sp.]MDD3596176.1 hypothetical protein [Sulfuricurvum sp.]
MSKYLRDGHRQDSEYSRNQKDETIPLYGDLDIFEKTEHFLNQHKDFSDNYMHITLSFSKEDIRRIEESGKDYLDVYRDMVQDYIKHHTSGYDIDNEVIAYAEVHRPKIKEEHGKERLEHIHIGIALYNPLDDTKLRTDFKHSNFIDDTLQEYVNKKHGLTNPREFKREREGINADTQIAHDRKYYIDQLKDIGDRKELLQYFHENGIDFREVQTAKNHYFKIITPGDLNDINLRGKGFEHLSDIAQGKEIKANAARQIEDLGKILTHHYENRIDQIHDRRSVRSKEAINQIYADEEEDQKDSISVTYQHKLFKKHYGRMTNHKFNGYFIDLDSSQGVTFTNEKRNINIVDHGDVITSNGIGNVKERAALMLDIAEAKEWDLSTLKITGSAAFKKEMHRQIAERIRERGNLINNPAAIDIARPTSRAEKIAADLHDEKQISKQEERDIEYYKSVAHERSGTLLNANDAKELVKKHTKERNEAAKIDKESPEFRAAQRKFMDAQAIMRNGVKMEDIYDFNDMQVREKRLTETDAERFAQNTLHNARELTRIGIFKEIRHEHFEFVDEKAKEILSSNIGVDYRKLFEINLAEWEKAASMVNTEMPIDDAIPLATIKSELSAAAVLQYAAEQYKLNTANYELTNDNKINNLNNKQKPKNVIDFMQKELNLSGYESIEICRDLFNQQRQSPQLQTVPISGTHLDHNINLQPGVKNVTAGQRRVALREPNTQQYGRRKSNTADNMPVLSASQLVSDIGSVELLLQNHDDTDLQRRSEDVSNRLRYAAARNDSAQNRNRINKEKNIMSHHDKERLIAQHEARLEEYMRKVEARKYAYIAVWVVFKEDGVVEGDELKFRVPESISDEFRYLHTEVFKYGKERWGEDLVDIAFVGFGDEGPYDYEVPLPNPNQEIRMAEIIRIEEEIKNMPEPERIPMEEEIEGMSDLICNDPYMDDELSDEPAEKHETLQISICKDSNPNALNKWETVDVANYTDLTALMKQYPYSAAQFENGYRNSENAVSQGNVLIYDIDNDEGKPQLSISEATELLEAKGVSAMILPSKSHNKDKNGYIAERFRIIVPTTETLSAGIEKEEYREFQKLAAKALDLDRFVDTKALNDKARFYYKSPIAAVPHIVKANSVMKTNALQIQARSNVARRRAEAEAERSQVEQIRQNVAKHRMIAADTGSKYLTQADTHKMMSIPIADLIRHFDKAEEYEEGTYHMLKTEGSKYSIVEDNVAHDFKNDVTYNSITYLQKHFKTQNLNAIARELEKETGESYIITNHEAVRQAVDTAMKNAVNDKALEEALKENFNVKYCKFDPAHETITIADREIKLNEIEQSRQQLIGQFRANREQYQQHQIKSPGLKLK